MLTGDNSILKRAVDAKEQNERAEIEEALNVAYINLAGNSRYSDEANLDDAVTIVQNQGYKDKIKGMPGGAYKLSSTNIILSKTAPDNTQEIKLEKDTSTSSGGTWYAVINGKYFKIEENDGDIRIAKEPSNVNPNSGASGDTINITSSDVTIAKENDKEIATFDVTAGDTVKVTASNEGSSKITINANGKTYTGDITVVSTIEQAPANLDGALELLAATDTSNQNGKNQDLKNVVMTTTNSDVATITTEGIVKCNKVADKEAIISAKQGETTRYFKVKSTATLAKPTKMTSNKTIDGKKTGTANNPIIPKDFYPVNTEKAKWAYDNTNNKVTDVDEGLVIMDEKGNQFVWVPVRDIKDMVMCANNNKDGHTCNIVFDGTNILCTSTGHSDEIVGKLYATSIGEKYKINLDTTPYTYTQNSGLREPDILEDDDRGDFSTTENAGLNLITRYVKEYIGKDITTEANSIKLGWTQQIKNEFYKMALSVAKSGGFYIGRYETSLINEETRVVAGATSISTGTASAGTWYGLYQKEKDFITADNWKSTMIWGSQYDALMNWIGDNSIIKDTSGNNANLDYNRRTGVVSTDKINNIFDLYGLRVELTMEASNVKYRIYRGGNYDYKFSPSIRVDSSVTHTNIDYSSRITLYIQ